MYSFFRFDKQISLNLATTYICFLDFLGLSFTWFPLFTTKTIQMTTFWQNHIYYLQVTHLLANLLFLVVYSVSY